MISHIDFFSILLIFCFLMYFLCYFFSFILLLFILFFSFSFFLIFSILCIFFFCVSSLLKQIVHLFLFLHFVLLIFSLFSYEFWIVIDGLSNQLVRMIMMKSKLHPCKNIQDHTRALICEVVQSLAIVEFVENSMRFLIVLTCLH